ncbi:MAG: NAD(P)-dependent alcohol dehydrogenase [Ginsengibacter sp.]
MKAIHLEAFGIENLQLTDIPVPAIGNNEVLVKMSAASLQYLDLLVIEGKIFPDLKFPYIPVSEGMGIVEKVGNKVTYWKQGDRVLIPFITRWQSGKINSYKNELRTGLQLQGILSEFSVQPGSTLVAAPKNLKDEEAAPLSVAGLTAWSQLVTQARIKSGQTILVQGSGGISLFALQIAKLFGLKIIATTGNKEKVSKLKELGANEVINYKEVQFLSEEVKRLNGGVGVDVTLDVGGRNTLMQSVLSCKENGYVGLVGFLSGSEITIDILPVIMNYIRIQGYSVGNASQLSDFVNAIEINNLKPVIDRVFTIEKTKDAFLKLKSGEAFGKIIIKF